MLRVTPREVLEKKLLPSVLEPCGSHGTGSIPVSSPWFVLRASRNGFLASWVLVGQNPGYRSCEVVDVVRFCCRWESRGFGFNRHVVEEVLKGMSEFTCQA